MAPTSREVDVETEAILSTFFSHTNFVAGFLMFATVQCMRVALICCTFFYQENVWTLQQAWVGLSWTALVLAWFVAAIVNVVPMLASVVRLCRRTHMVNSRYDTIWMTFLAAELAVSAFLVAHLDDVVVAPNCMLSEVIAGSPSGPWSPQYVPCSSTRSSPR
jgi:hypothetical protein